jgi:hypothetical protein
MDPEPAPVTAAPPKPALSAPPVVEKPSVPATPSVEPISSTKSDDDAEWWQE